MEIGFKIRSGLKLGLGLEVNMTVVTRGETNALIEEEGWGVFIYSCSAGLIYSQMNLRNNVTDFKRKLVGRNPTI